MGPAMFCLAVRPGLTRFRQEFEREGVETFEYTDDTFLGLMGITVNTIRAFAFLRRELEESDIVVITWLYHQKTTPRRPRRFRSSIASTSALPTDEG